MAYLKLCNGKGKTSNGNGFTTSAFDTTGSNFLAVAVSWYQVATAVLSDSKGNTWAGLTTYNANSPRVRLYHCIAPTVGSGHTFTIAGNPTFASIAFAGFSGAKVSSPFGGENGNGANASTNQAGSVTPSEDNCLVISGVGWDGGGATLNDLTINGGFTRSDWEDWVNSVNEAVGLAYLIQTTAAAANPTWTRANGSGESGAAIGWFKAEPVAAGIFNKSLFVRQAVKHAAHY